MLILVGLNTKDPAFGYSPHVSHSLDQCEDYLHAHLALTDARSLADFVSDAVGFVGDKVLEEGREGGIRRS